MMLNNALFIIGFMGTGKSSCGKVLSEKLGVPFYDTDKIIEDNEGRTIEDIFKNEGEEYFRKCETDYLNSIPNNEPRIISTGGGMPCWGDNLNIMKSKGVVISLISSPEEILRRISSEKTVRPLLACDNPLNKIISLLQKRAYYYINAHILIDTDNKNIEDIAEEIIKRLDL